MKTLSIIQSAIWLVSLLRTSPVVGFVHVDTPQVDDDLAVLGVAQLDVRLVEDGEPGGKEYWFAPGGFSVIESPMRYES